MDPVAVVTGGQVVGTSDARFPGVNAFLAVPYAAPAVGRDRYRAPRPVKPWSGTRDATRHGPTAAQTAYPAPMDAVLPSSVNPGEDYLTVSVWAPEAAEGLPVMVWIHGGAFTRGASSVAAYDGSAFARDGVVMVGVNYRLGAPGFAVLDGAPTNLGLRDQVAALAWVRDNVAAFGGDPDDVTLFGESAGAMSVATLMSSPAAEGLFHRAILQSGAATSACTLADARLVGAELAAELGVPATAEAFGDLDPEVVLAAQTAVGLAIQADPDPQRWGASVLAGGLGIMSLFPVIDGDVVPAMPLAAIADGSAAGMPVLIGTTREEYRLFLVGAGLLDAITTELLPLFAARYGWPDGAIETYSANRPDASAGDIAGAILTDAAFRVPSTVLAAALHTAGGPVHCYELGWPTPVNNLGACHALELGFVFDTLGPATAMAGEDPPQHLADEMHRAWVAFARGGDPGWAGWSPERPAVMTFDLESALVEGPRADELALWSPA